MKPTDETPEERLADRALQGFAEGSPTVVPLEELAELEALERAAAAAHLAWLGRSEPMPETAARRVREQATAYWTGFAAASAQAPPPPAALPETRLRWRRDAGWYAAAACLALAVVGWGYGRRFERPPVPIPRLAEIETRTERAADRVSLPLKKGTDPLSATVSGTLVWSTGEQAGYIELHGLRPNDPTLAQYQLWIFDAEQDEKFPIDGGVFDVPKGREARVPISPRLRVRKPTLFAITLEKPGGVVVSKRDRLVVMAKVS
jgi:hypothetical protein